MVFVHGHKENCWSSVWFGYKLAQAGFVVFIPTQRGYPFSGGKRDFCGPKTTKGVLDGIRIFLKIKLVNKKKMGIWGVSRGAKVAALLATQKPESFKAAVFQSGGYDLKTEIKETLPNIRKTIAEEIKLNKKEIDRRSPLKDMNKISSFVLILHGNEDERISVKQARLLDKRLTELKKRHQTIIVKNAGHFVSQKTTNRYTLPFLIEHVKRNPQ